MTYIKKNTLFERSAHSASPSLEDWRPGGLEAWKFGGLEAWKGLEAWTVEITPKRWQKEGPGHPKWSPGASKMEPGASKMAPS